MMLMSRLSVDVDLDVELNNLGGCVKPQQGSLKRVNRTSGFPIQTKDSKPCQLRFGLKHLSWLASRSTNYFIQLALCGAR